MLNPSVFQNQTIYPSRDMYDSSLLLEPRILLSPSILLTTTQTSVITMFKSFKDPESTQIPSSSTSKSNLRQEIQLSLENFEKEGYSKESMEEAKMVILWYAATICEQLDQQGNVIFTNSELWRKVLIKANNLKLPVGERDDHEKIAFQQVWVHVLSYIKGPFPRGTNLDRMADSMAELAVSVRDAVIEPSKVVQYMEEENTRAKRGKPH